MAELTLISKSDRPFRAIVEAALMNEYEELHNGIQKTQDRVRYFEEKYQMSTSEFLERFAQNKLEHSFDFDEWIGESRMLDHLVQKAETLRSIEVAN